MASLLSVPGAESSNQVPPKIGIQKARESMEQDLSREFLKVVEEGAIAAAKTMGIGDRKFSDQAAVEAMRASMETIPMNGTIVIGEGERDEAPMLFIGEKVGKKKSGKNFHE